MLEALTLSELTDALDARLTAPMRSFDGVSTDSARSSRRTVHRVDAAPRFDGHDYLNDAARQGAVGALVGVKSPTHLAATAGRQTPVGPRELGALAAQHFTQPVVGVTGSSGKTTVKQMLAAHPAHARSGAGDPGNLNNDLGAAADPARTARGHTLRP